MGVVSSALVALVVLYADPIVLTGPIVHRDPEQPPERLSYTLGLKAELRSGHPLGFNSSGTSGPARTEAELDPLAGLRLPLDGGGLTLTYEPRIFIVGSHVPDAPDGTPGRHVSYLHRARATVEYQPSERWKLFVNGRFAYGQYDFSPLTTVVPGAPGSIGTPGGGTSPTPSTTSPTLPIPGPGTPPNQASLDVEELAGGAGFVHNLSPGLSFLLSGGYARRGGSTSEAQQALPLQKGPMGATGLQGVLGPNDSWTLLASGTSSSFSTGVHATLLDLTGTWSHSWSRTFQTDLTAGGTALHSSGVLAPGGGIEPTVDKVLPVAALGFTHRVLQPRGDVMNVLQLRVAPLPDQLSGAIYERFEAVLLSAVPLVGHLWLEVSSGMSIAVSGPQLDVRAEGKLTYLFGPWLGLSAGGRTAWLRGAEPASEMSFGWVGFVAIGTYFSAPF
jgi:hypothetical protein